ncbi:Zn-ribbon domain-containing OB-fold protein [Actinomadura graeca]|uniref:Zn-ribbon domain-containing OB-fold protein n=1 Tax=Actinomadura graeca TaxID=2750812 RepID=A0ABX8QZ48_9ACTN|nr:Zn-ribbon domain-containing OB-fold protein [Actinomadura graeca]QXJ23274.1 Zn-ribbon domain-containing OB-fold protein [Actinomadura graeca]
MTTVRTDSALPVPAPDVNPDTAEFWAATQEGRLLVTRCSQCGEAVWYPRPICPFCHSTDTVLEQASGRGTVYTFSIVRRAPGEWGQATPYVLAYVELEEGPRVMTNIVDCSVEDVYIGAPVEVVFFDTGEGAALPRFRLVDA